MHVERVSVRLEPFDGVREAWTPGDELVFSTDGDLMFVASQAGELVAFETETWTERWRQTLGDHDLLFRIRPEDGLLCATARVSWTRHLIDAVSGEVVERGIQAA